VPGAAPRDPRLLRARDGGTRAGAAWRARAWTIARVATLVVLLIGSGWYVQHVMTSGEAFAVQKLHVIGVSRLSQGEVQGLLAGLVGRNIVRTSLEPWRQKLLASPWVREASLRRALPSTIEVRITERLPMAVARAGDLLLLIDEQGAVVDEFGPRYGRLDLPIVDGLVDTAAPPATPPDEARVALVSSVLGVADRRAAAAQRRGDALGRHGAVAGRARAVRRACAGLPRHAGAAHPHGRAGGIGGFAVRQPRVRPPAQVGRDLRDDATGPRRGNRGGSAGGTRGR
jgi:hypothetical protein